MNRAALAIVIVGFVSAACSSIRDNAIGESCECNTQCMSGSYCADSTGHDIPEEDNGLGGSCAGDGTCEPLRTQGQSCDYGIPCDKGLRCLGVEPRTCEPLQPEGAPCKDPRDCASGLTCNASLDTPRCATPGGIGGTCASDTDCEAGLVCNASVAECQAPQSVPEGSPCSDDAQCAPTLVCHNTGYCEPVGDNGALWHEGTSTCVPSFSVPSGERCHRDDECTSGQCTETVSGICTLRSCA
jgi:hypothetical protein